MFPEACEIGIGFGGAFGAIDDEDTFQWKSAGDSEFFDFGAEFSFRHGCEFIEERKDK